MKILLAHKFFHFTGGAEVFFFETGRLLQERGHHVAYFSTCHPKNLESEYSKFFVDPPNFKGVNILKHSINIKKLIFSKEAKLKFSKLLDHFKPDIIHVFAIHTHLTPSILVAAHEKNIPVVMSCNDYKHICPNYKLFHHNRICRDCEGRQFYKAIVNRCCHESFSFSVASCIEAYVHYRLGIYKRFVHTYLFSSQFMAKETERFWGRESFRWDILRNPFNSTTFPLVESYANYFLYFGRLINEKGLDILLRSMAFCPDAHLKIVGDGPDAQRLIEQARGFNNIEFLGPKWGDDIDQLIKGARFVVVPSIWHENFPYVINQSFAFGKPVIGTDRGGIPELISHGERGLIYPAHDHKALAKCIKDLWDNPCLTGTLGANAKKFSNREFNDDCQYQKLVNIYERIINESSRSGR